MERSYNGWTASPNSKDFGGLDNRAVAGVKMVPGVRRGDVATVLFYVAEQFHARVENLVSPGCWGHAYRKNRNAANLSCHSSATAIDLNARRHPNGKRGTFTKGQVAEIRKILAAVGGIVRWGGDFTGTPDEMHFEIVASPATVAMVAERLSRTGSVSSPVTTLPAAPSAPVQEDDMYDNAARDELVGRIDMGFAHLTNLVNGLEASDTRTRIGVIQYGMNLLLARGDGDTIDYAKLAAALAPVLAPMVTEAGTGATADEVADKLAERLAG